MDTQPAPDEQFDRRAEKVTRGLAGGATVYVLPGYRFEQSEVYTLMPKGSSQLRWISSLLDLFGDVLREKV